MQGKTTSAEPRQSKPGSQAKSLIIEGPWVPKDPKESKIRKYDEEQVSLIERKEKVSLIGRKAKVLLIGRKEQVSLIGRKEQVLLIGRKNSFADWEDNLGTSMKTSQTSKTEIL